MLSGGLTGTTATFTGGVTITGGLTGTTATFTGGITITGGLTGTTATFTGGITGTSVVLSGGLTGTTATFTGGVTVAGGLTGTTATFTGLTVTGGLTGNTAFFNSITVASGITFNNLSVGGITGTTATFTGGITGTSLVLSGGLTGTTATFNNLTVLGGISGNTAIFNGITVFGGITGNTAYFSGGITGVSAILSNSLLVGASSLDPGYTFETNGNVELKAFGDVGQAIFPGPNLAQSIIPSITYGIRFSIIQPFTVTELQYYTGGITTGSRQVGLWDQFGDTLATATLSFGGPSVNGYYYQTITPVQLFGNTGVTATAYYVLGAEIDPGDTVVESLGTTYNIFLTGISNARSASGGGFTFPVGTGGGIAGNGNFEISRASN